MKNKNGLLVILVLSVLFSLSIVSAATPLKVVDITNVQLKTGSFDISNCVEDCIIGVSTTPPHPIRGDSGIYFISSNTFRNDRTGTTLAGVYISVDDDGFGLIVNPPGVTLTFTYDGGQQIDVYLPSTSPGAFFVAADGSTYYDEALTRLARAAPPQNPDADAD